MPKAISVSGLAKRYQLGSSGTNGYATLRDSIAENWLRPWKLLSGGSAAGGAIDNSEFWALQDINFEVKPGEVVGVIGRNGAGKSTLLKVLSRITRPTRGQIEIAGRMASLLEVGTGFHPELSGRDNIYLNGAILGMTRAEIRRKFDQIVAFAEVEKFIDTPVKRYSSGMYVRLAFSVAAHLDPDILVVDEVLSVGDSAFQKKCLGVMQDVARTDRTVLFVTHNLPLVRTLCTRALLLENGRLALDSSVEQVLSRYTKSVISTGDLSKVNLGDRVRRSHGNLPAIVKGLEAVGNDNKSRWIFESGETVRVRLTCLVREEVPSLGFSLALIAPFTNEVITTFKQPISTKALRAGEEFTTEITLENLPLRPGDFSFYIGLGDAELDRIYDLVDQNVDLPLLTITSEEADARKRMGYVSLPSHVEIKRVA